MKSNKQLKDKASTGNNHDVDEELKSNRRRRSSATQKKSDNHDQCKCKWCNAYVCGIGFI